MRSAFRFTAALFTLGLLLAAFVPAASARRAPLAVEAELVQRINDLRAGAGRGPIGADGRLARVAGRHATSLARAGALVHAPLGRILRATGARRAGEVIGRGTTPATMMQAWMASPRHRAILLDRRFRMAGAGVAAGTLGGAFTWYVTVDLAG